MKFFFKFIVFAVVMMFGSLAFSQETPQFVYAGKDLVKPGELESYIESTKTFNRLTAEHQLPFTLFTYQSSLTEFNYIMPLNSLSELGTIHAAYQKMADDIGTVKWLRLLEQLGGSMFNASSSIYVMRRDLSYEPEDPIFIFDPQKPCFAVTELYYTMPGYDHTIDELAKKFVELYKKHNVRVEFSIAQEIIGPDLPLYTSISHFENKQQYMDTMEQLRQTLGQELAQVQIEAMKYCRKIETREFYYRPDLTYIPGMLPAVEDTNDDTSEIQPNVKTTGPAIIDLSKFYNAKLDAGTEWGSEFTGSSGNTLSNNLSELPKGVNNLGGVEFSIDGIIQLWGAMNQSFPESVTGIPIDRPFQTLHVLHAGQYGLQEPAGTPVAGYILNYEDGTKAEFSVLARDHIIDWWAWSSVSGPTSNNSDIVWKGKNPVFRELSFEDQWGICNSVQLMKSSWENPSPEKKVVSIDLVSKKTNVAPFVVAITVE